MRLENRGLKPRSLRIYADAFLKADQFLAGAPITSATADEWTAFLADQRARYAPATVQGRLVVLRKILKLLLKVKALPEDLEEALYVRELPRRVTGRVIEAHEFHAMLEAAVTLYGSIRKRPVLDMVHALLWTLWDTGFRSSEVLALCLGDVTFDAEGGATIALRPEMDGLKTGPRTVYVVECAPVLRAWCELHPAAGDRHAPLWIGINDKTGFAPLAYDILYRTVVRCSDAAGLNGGPAKNVSPHDFRHSCATSKARLGWNEPQMRGYFGWAPGSDMPGIYVHLALGDMRDRVRADAGMGDLGYRAALEVGDDTAALGALLRRIMAQDQLARYNTKQ